MKVLITGAASRLGQLLARGLSADHSLRLTDRQDLSTELEFARSDLGHGEDTDELVTGVDAIVHPAYAAADGEGPDQWLDASTRCIYNLLLAASEADVKRVIYLGSLDVFRAYDPDMTVAEDWRPRPSLEAEELGPHMGEFVAREFAHSGLLEVVILRLGHVVAEEEARQQPFDPMWLDERDVVGGVSAALEQPVRDYAVFHLQHASERARFLHRHRHGHHRRGGHHRHGRRHHSWSLEYSPQHNFEEHV